MGNDSPLAVLSEKSQIIYNYFKQLFAQVTNPPIDPIREEIVTASITFIGSEGNLTSPSAESCRMIKYESPLVSDAVIRQLEGKLPESFTIRKIPMLFRPDFECVDGNDLKNSLSELFEHADQMIDEGANVLILS